MHATVEECSPLNISKTSTWEHCFDLAAQHHQYWQSMHMFLEESQNGVHTQADIVWWGTCSGAVISHAVEHRLQCTATERATQTYRRRQKKSEILFFIFSEVA